MKVERSAPIRSTRSVAQTAYARRAEAASSASLEGILAWVGSDQRFGHFAGLRFKPDQGLPNGSFLDRYLAMKSTGR